MNNEIPKHWVLKHFVNRMFGYVPPPSYPTLTDPNEISDESKHQEYEPPKPTPDEQGKLNREAFYQDKYGFNEAAEYDLDLNNRDIS